MPAGRKCKAEDPPPPRTPNVHTLGRGAFWSVAEEIGVLKQEVDVVKWMWVSAGSCRQ